MTSPTTNDRLPGVVVVEAIGIIRMSLRMAFESDPAFEFLGEASNADEALDLVRVLPNHSGVVILVGVELSGPHDSFWLIRAIRDELPSLTILATGTDLQPGAVPQSLFMGADGFIHKNSSAERFLEATRRAAAGELVLEGLPKGAIGEFVENGDAKRGPSPTLTERELGVLSAAADGATAREIGRKLGVTERTVTTHLNHIYRKLGVSSRTGALSIALKLGLVSLQPIQANHAGNLQSIAAS
jgi:DNA-binding NarL/FixJ family response regulator